MGFIDGDDHEKLIADSDGFKLYTSDTTRGFEENLKSREYYGYIENPIVVKVIDEKESLQYFAVLNKITGEQYFTFNGISDIGFKAELYVMWQNDDYDIVNMAMKKKKKSKRKLKK